MSSARGESPTLLVDGPASDLANGMLVRHATLGVGKVVAVERMAVHVFFPNGGRRYAAKFHVPATAHLSSVGVERDAWLEGLTSFSLDPVTRRYALAENFISHDEAIAEFHATYPHGFLDPTYVGTGKGERAARWRAAVAEWAESLGGGQAERLFDAGDVRDLIRRVLRVERHLVLAPGLLPAGTLAEALRDETAAAAFLEAVLALLAVPSPARARFERLFGAARDLDVEPAQMWPIATLLPFVAAPAKYVFLSPKSACGAAARLGCDLRFAAEPNWGTYSAFRAFEAKLLSALRPGGARDFVDVECFLHAIAARRAPAAVRKAPRAAARKPARRRTRV